MSLFDTYWPFAHGYNQRATAYTTSQTTAPQLTFTHPSPAIQIEYIPPYATAGLQNLGDSNHISSVMAGSGSGVPPLPYPVSYGLGDLSKVLLLLFVAALVHVIVRDKRHRIELRLLSRRVRQLEREGSFMASALRANGERVEWLGEGVDVLNDAIVEVCRCMMDALGEHVGQAGREEILESPLQSMGKQTAAAQEFGLDVDGEYRGL